MSDFTPEKLPNNSDNDIHWDKLQKFITKFDITKFKFSPSEAILKSELPHTTVTQGKEPKQANFTGEVERQPEISSGEMAEDFADAYDSRIDVSKLLNTPAGREALYKYQDKLITFAEHIENLPGEIFNVVFNLVDIEGKTNILQQLQQEMNMDATVTEQYLVRIFLDYFRVGKLDNLHFSKSLYKRIFSFFRKVKKFILWMDKHKEELKKLCEDFVNETAFVAVSNDSQLQEILKKGKQENVDLIRQYNPNISVEDLLHLENIIRDGETENLKLLFQYIPDLSLADLENLSSIIIKGRKANFELIFDTYENISLAQLKELGDIICYGKQANLELIFDTYENISLAQLKELGDIIYDGKQANLELIFNTYKDISLDQLKELEDIVSWGKKENLELIFNTYKDISLDQLKDFRGIICHGEKESINWIFTTYGPLSLEQLKNLRIISRGKKENLELMFNTYKNISLDQRQELGDIICHGQQANLELIFHTYGILPLDKLKELGDIISYGQQANLELIFHTYEKISLAQLKDLKDIICYGEKESINWIFTTYGPLSLEQLKNLGIVSRGKKENLELIFNTYKNISLDQRQELGDIVSRGKKENLELIFNTYKDISLAQLKELGDIISWGKKENLELIFNTYKDISLDQLQELGGIIYDGQQANLELIFKRYSPLLLEDLKALKDIFLYGEGDNIATFLSKYPHLELPQFIKIQNILFRDTDVLERMIQHYGSLHNLYRLGFCEASSEQVTKFLQKMDEGVDFDQMLVIEHDLQYQDYGYSKDEIESFSHYRRGQIITKLADYVQDYVSKQQDLGVVDLFNVIRVDVLALPFQERIYFLSKIFDIVKKFNTVRKYLNFETSEYKTPKDLLCAIRGITDPELKAVITDDITVRQYRTGLVFFVGDSESYQKIYDRSMTDSGARSGGFNTAFSAILDLDGVLSVVNDKDPGDEKNYAYTTIIHESRHGRNTDFMQDQNTRAPLTRAKDEITAYLKNGGDIGTIKSSLTRSQDEGGLYQYNLQGEKWEQHKKHVIELVDYASELIDLSKIPSTGISRDDVISILSDVPCGLWEQVHDVMMEATKLQQEEFLSLKSSQNLLSGMEVSDEEKVRSLKNSFLSLSKKSTTFLLTVWNKMFSRQKINLEGLWRTCNATKEDVLNSLTHVRNLDKMIRILKDPKYSHIAYGINHKSGIEVAAMVKSFQSGQLDLTYLPPEIQSIIQAKHLH